MRRRWPFPGASGTCFCARCGTAVIETTALVIETTSVDSLFLLLSPCVFPGSRLHTIPCQFDSQALVCRWLSDISCTRTGHFVSSRDYSKSSIRSCFRGYAARRAAHPLLPKHDAPHTHTPPRARIRVVCLAPPPPPPPGQWSSH